jgi:hypothetical protein
MMPNQPMPPGMASQPQIPQQPQAPGAMPPGLGPQQGQPIPLSKLLPNADQIQQMMMGSQPAPSPLVKDADQSTGLHPDDSTTPDPANVDEGLPAHRLVEMYTAWSMSKMQELTNQLRYEQFYHGYQWTDEQNEVLKQRKQPNTYFNETRKKIDSYVGIEQRLRRDPKAQPRSPKHEGDCDAATAALREINQLTNSPLKFSEAGRDFFNRGIGCLWQGVEKKSNGQIEVVKRRVPGFNFIYDPRSLEWDFSDAKFLGEWGLVDVEDARDMFNDLGVPESADKVDALVGNMGSGMSGASSGLPGEWARLKGEWYNRQLQRVRLVHMYYRYKRQWRCAYFCGYIKLYDQPSIYKDEDGGSRHPFNPVSCHVDETGERYGVTKDLIPIQEAINVRSSKLTWLINARQMIYEEGAVDDVNIARVQLNRPDGMVKLKPGGLAKVKIEQLNTEIEGQAKLLESSIEMMRNYGPNPSLLGKDGQDASGRAILVRQNSGMTEMSSVFERHREFKIKAYKKDWLLVRQFWTQERWIRTTDDDKGFTFLPINQYVFDPKSMRLRKNNDIALMDIDVIIDEGPDVITQTEELMDLLGKLGQSAGTWVGEAMIELSNVRNKDRLLKIIEKYKQEAAPKQDPDMADLLKKKNFLEVALQAAEIDEKLANVENKRATTLKTLNDGFIDSNAMQAFPFEYGARTTYEDFLGEPIHPQGNPNVFAPNLPPMPMGGPQGMMPPSGGPSPMMPQGGPPRMPNLPQGKNAIGIPPPAPLPNQEPHLGQAGPLPLPAADSSQAQALMPPSNTRL